MKAVAGTGQIVAFGIRYEEKGTLRKEKARAENPEAYPLGFGLTKVTKRNYKPINELLALHEAKGAGKDDSKSKKQ